MIWDFINISKIINVCSNTPIIIIKGHFGCFLCSYLNFNILCTFICLRERSFFYLYLIVHVFHLNTEFTSNCYFLFTEYENNV